MSEIPKARLWSYAELVELDEARRLKVTGDRVTFDQDGHRFGFEKSVLRNARAFVEQNPGKPGHGTPVDWLGPT